jgi:DNA-binding PadR family transcriptional regulator
MKLVVMPHTKNTKPVTGKIPDSLPASDVVVLAHVALRKQGISGKEIDRLFDLQGTRTWADIGSSSVYNCLKRLEQYEYVTSEQDKKEGHGIRLYFATPEGRYTLEKELIYRLSTDRRRPCELDVAIANLPFLKKEKVLKSLENYGDDLEKNLQFLESNILPLKEFGLFMQKNPDERIGNTTAGKTDPRDVELILALFERPYRELRARKQWLREFIQKIKDGYVWCADQEPTLQLMEKVWQQEEPQKPDGRAKEKEEKSIQKPQK